MTTYETDVKLNIIFLFFYYLATMSIIFMIVETRGADFDNSAHRLFQWPGTNL
jgi:hypothetical protein